MTNYIFAIFTFLAVVHSTVAAKCSEIMNCQRELQAYATSSNNYDLNDFCPKLSVALACMDEAFADCHTLNLPNETREQFKMIKTELRNQLTGICIGGDRPSCINFRTCEVIFVDVAKTLNDSSTTEQERCSALGKGVSCYEKVVQDCERTKVLSGRELEEVESRANDVTHLYQQKCVDSNNAGSVKSPLIGLVLAVAVMAKLI